jgi:hypothetical protein
VQLVDCEIADFEMNNEQIAQITGRTAERQRREEARRREAQLAREKEERDRREEARKHGTSSAASQYAEESVKRLLRYPDQAQFSWSNVGNVTGTEGRWSCSGKFTAINPFGVKENMRYVALLQFHEATYYEIMTTVVNEAGTIVGTSGDGRWKSFP